MPQDPPAPKESPARKARRESPAPQGPKGDPSDPGQWELLEKVSLNAAAASFERTFSTELQALKVLFQAGSSQSKGHAALGVQHQRWWLSCSVLLPPVLPAARCPARPPAPLPAFRHFPASGSISVLPHPAPRCTACGRSACRKQRPECGCQPEARQADPDRGHQCPACRPGATIELWGVPA